MTTYAAISDGSAGPSARPSSDEMPRSRRRNWEGAGQASMLSSIINLLNTIVGAGTLAMPSVLSHMGIVLGSIMIVWSGLTAAFGLYLQGRCARYLDCGRSSFFAISKLTYPNAAVFFDGAIAVKCFGVGVSYLIIIGDLMPKVVLGFDSSIPETRPYLVQRDFWVTAFMLLVIPLSFLRKLDSLKYTSIVALFSIGYLVILVVYHFGTGPLADKNDLRIVQPQSAIAFLSSLPVVVFAYTCHQNMFSILNEIKDASPGSIVGVVGTSIGSAASMYVLVAVTGYLTFGNKVTGNIVSMYDPSLAILIGQLGIVLLVTFSIPLQVHPCRASVDAVLKWRPNRGQNNPGARANSPNNDLPLLNPAVAPGSARPDSAAAPMSDTRFALLTSVILVASYLVALSVSSLERVLAYVGSIGSTSISFILPGLFYYKISDPESIHHQRLLKEDDDAGDMLASDDDDDEEADPALANSIQSIRSAASVALDPRKWRRRWRWDLEHLEHDLLRKLAIGLAGYGVIVMVVCLTMNLVFEASH
ncbi:vacuolar amino acid transporter 5 [Sodiomyces alkalinus F11]|uniref:Vacuolar amino acid transporter 5 n=1 Tax=Sodiomyces alkalinus (strain CBS 110278 / VKM F-3762 / F11) TaxID=1314773 RepID=A0A3N2Q329_SODAK|nr:vacuolar amino acid transporter 5 [Sodiomyces alkalinus F11]ROT41078.1 vacuolar amino acid transporter 5 [Sodiomyces alkalinus F11]